jgi:CRISPR/Cas system CSM-associated protein Csm2 small subunit
VSPERVEEYKKQRIKRGFDDTECWNLDTTILQFVLPRLKRFRECTIGYPSEFESLENWTECLDKMIDNIDKIIKSEEDADYEGFELFKKYFFNLWW